MKKYLKKILIISLIAATLALCSCAQNVPEDVDSIPVYYVSSSETKVELHEYVFESVDFESRLHEVLDVLSTLPDKLEYKPPLSMGFELLDYNLTDSLLTLNVDENYLSLPATTEVLVRAAIVRTLTQFDEIEYVGITVNGNRLYDNAGEQVGWMNADKFIDNDGNEINTYEQIKVKLFFADESGQSLIAAFREKYYSTNTPVERFVVEELIAGPSGQIAGLFPTINPETKIISVTTRDGICYVNLDESFLTVINNVSLENSIYSIVNSLVELSNINKVQILINGEVPATFSTSVFERNLDNVTTLDK